MNERFASYQDFFVFYLRQHSHPGNRIIHACGTAIGIGGTIVAVAIGRPWLVLAWIAAAYALNWIGHFLVEGNKPATFGHPWWSLVSDFRMLGMMMTGKLPMGVETPGHGEPSHTHSAPEEAAPPRAAAK